MFLLDGDHRIADERRGAAGERGDVDLRAGYEAGFRAVVQGGVDEGAFAVVWQYSEFALRLVGARG
ncbi:hypothetical protein [Amycolatopsis thermophila]|uniref:Uncharacterized protein n=1 Tax=Amycolatopsis thermophila TaxID=206084 RepID=A0ABU0EYL5_9PSEU|nr:hypothetical protein [Amycolatopsis thermophila]MDQ0380405.1 hypothetical protein [Amycolatopsis thermophila]